LVLLNDHQDGVVAESTSDGQDQSAFLDQVASFYRERGGKLQPVASANLGRRAEHFASCVHFGLDHPEAMRQLSRLQEQLYQTGGLGSLVQKVLEDALSIAGGDFGNVQVIDPLSGSLRIVSQTGFGRDFLEYFAVVDDGHSACGRAAGQSAQVVIFDVDKDPGFAPHRAIAHASGFRAVQSTPLVGLDGHVVGMVSTHFRAPNCPSDRELHTLRLYADLAGAAISHMMGSLQGDDPAEVIGRAVLSTLLDRGRSSHQEMEDPERSFPQHGGGVV
jgi:GAF domain-containing protein